MSSLVLRGGGGGGFSTFVDFGMRTVNIKDSTGKDVTVDGKTLTKKVFDAANANNKLAIDYIDRELKIGLTQKREASLAKAMANPEGWINDRGHLMDVVRLSVASHYAERMATYKDMGLSFEEAGARALRSANNILADQLEDIELTHPGSATIWGSAANQMANRNTQFNLAMGSAEEKAQLKAKYKRKYRGKQNKGTVTQ